MQFPPVLWKASLWELSRALVWCVFGLWHFPQGRTMQKPSVTPEERLLTPPHPAPVTSYLSFTSVILSF